MTKTIQIKEEILRELLAAQEEALEEYGPPLDLKAAERLDRAVEAVKFEIDTGPPPPSGCTCDTRSGLWTTHDQNCAYRYPREQAQR